MLPCDGLTSHPGETTTLITIKCFLKMNDVKKKQPTILSYSYYSELVGKLFILINCATVFYSGGFGAESLGMLATKVAA